MLGSRLCKTKCRKQREAETIRETNKYGTKENIPREKL